MANRSFSARPAKAEPALALTKAVIRAADLLGLKQADLAEVLGNSATTVSRMRNEEYQLNQKLKEWEFAMLLVRLYRGLASILASDETAVRSWMTNQNLDLNAVPLEYIKTVTGLVETVAYVDANRAHI